MKAITHCQGKPYQFLHNIRKETKRQGNHRADALKDVMEKKQRIFIAHIP
ncbi:hypothetical protein [Bacillus sp. FJAT-49736]|nr:hypothetical protein [Bacillus sp. FJAT-49736]MBS4173109.1 hypothetical protein [Bacillus sp. FJAT-49736]